MEPHYWEIELRLNQVCIGGRRTMTCRYVPHSPNKKMHWATKHKWTDGWKEEVYNAWRIHPDYYKFQPTFPWQKANVMIVVHQTKLMDKDNLYASCKPIIDGIKELGVLVDDSPEHVHLVVMQEKVSRIKEQHVYIKIWQNSKSSFLRTARAQSQSKAGAK